MEDKDFLQKQSEDWYWPVAKQLRVPVHSGTRDWEQSPRKARETPTEWVLSWRFLDWNLLQV